MPRKKLATASGLMPAEAELSSIAVTEVGDSAGGFGWGIRLGLCCDWKTVVTGKRL
ncbi:MAG: hypothetical protein M1483_02995 [Actinobacteria bacterium]|nr:hypothetical protein [Actinomycetota bacterium]MCL6104591.1 hypothetical protein [Actinomycetota bacterium]